MKLFGTNSRDCGSKAEEVARRYLEQRGLRYLARNVSGRFGELDLVMQDGPCLVFVEVRYRRSARFGGAVASIDAGKQRRLLATAQGYLQRHPHPGPCRFDVVAISGEAHNIAWLQNAIELSE